VQVLAYMLIYASLIRLRAHEPQGNGTGFRIPLPTAGVLVAIVPSVVLAGLMVFESLRPEGGLSATQAAGFALLFGSGPLAYWAFRR